MSATSADDVEIPLFGLRKFARLVLSELHKSRMQCKELRAKLEKFEQFGYEELEKKRDELAAAILIQRQRSSQEQRAAELALEETRSKLEDARKGIVVTEDAALLQEAGIYGYRHPLTQIAAYEGRLQRLEEQIKDMVRNREAILATTDWSVNGSKAEGARMVREFSQLMLRAFNTEADNLVRSLKPYKLDAAIEKLKKSEQTIERLGKTMNIKINDNYLALRVQELELTADFLQRKEEEKESERVERERLRDERKAQQELERERERLEKERRHYENAIAALQAKGDHSGVDRLRTEMCEVDRAIADVDYRAANVRAGYVYVVSNVGAFGESMVKVGLTRRLDPLDRIRELSDASVPFNFDVHAVFFSKDAVGIETAMHEKLKERRVNIINLRREFFRATPAEVKVHLASLAGELLEYRDDPEALEYRQCLKVQQPPTAN